jgi:hypothetical protein
MAPARYMSWDSSALSSSGPVVGKLSTTETMTDPETSPGRVQPTVLTNGLSAMRTGYLSTSVRSSRPLARAVSTYGRWSSSSRFARMIRISPAVPPMPSTTIGIHRCCAKSTRRPMLHGLLAYSGENSPPTVMPKREKANHMTTSASRKLGTPSPTKLKNVNK